LKCRLVALTAHVLDLEGQLWDLAHRLARIEFVLHQGPAWDTWGDSTLMGRDRAWWIAGLGEE